MKRHLIDLSDEVWGRTRARLEGLTDEEYLWDPAGGSWSIHPVDGAAGRWRHEWMEPTPEPAPFTTIAWRLWHLIDMYGEDRAWRWLDLPPQGAAVGLDDPDGSPPGTAAEALALLDAAHARWDAHLHLVTEESLAEPVGPVAGRYADASRAGYVLHMIDEFVHHGAELSLLRDLWRWRQPLSDDPLADRAVRGDLGVLDALEDVPGERASELMRLAASYGRWELVRRFVAAGVAVPTRGTTPLHRAAIAGELEVVQLLVAHGVGVAARDPEFDAPPVEWARFMGHDHVVDWLSTHHPT